MSSIKKPMSITLCILILVPILFSSLFITGTIADSSSGNTELYFKDALDINEIEYDSSGTFQLLSTIPPTKEIASSYPPLLINDISLSNGISLIDNETFIAWFSTWAITLLDDIEGFEEYFNGFDDIFEQMELIMPNPLRIVEAYEHTGEEAIQLNGNINYNLYFNTKPSSRIQKNDKVDLSLYTYDQNSIVPTKIVNKSLSLQPGFFQKSIQHSISISNVSETIQPGQLVLFSIELVPGNKTISSTLTNEYPLLKELGKVVLKVVRNIANFTGFTQIEDIFLIVNEVKNLLEGDEFDFNITIDDFADVLESLISFSFLYDSSDYPSSVTVPFRTASNSDDNSITYFLHSNNNMNTNQPTSTTQQKANLAHSAISWSGPTFSRSKLLSDFSAIIYIEHKDIQIWSPEMIVDAELTYGNTTLSSDSITLERTGPLSSSFKPYKFNFNDIGSDMEIEYGEKINLKLSLKNSSNMNNILRNVNVVYGANDCESLLSFFTSETNHISTSGSSVPADGKIIVGDTVSYTLDITSELEDTISINIIDDSFSSDEQSFWDVYIPQNSFLIDSGKNKTITISLNSLGTTLDAYDEEPLEITLEIIGKTGYDTFQIYAEVSDDAVTYDTIIQKPSDKEIVHGTNETFTFIIENNNTGLWKDSFSFHAEIDKNLSVIADPTSFDNLEVGNQTIVNVTVQVPKNTEIDEATIMLFIESKRSQIQHQVSVNITVIGGNVFEVTFDYFKDIAKSIGLEEVFGSYAPIILVSIIIIVIFLILIIMAFILTNKYVELICIDRIKKINPGKKAKYKLKLKNITNKTHTYTLSSDLHQRSSSWNSSFSSNRISIPAKQHQTVILTISATEKVKSGEWNEFYVKVGTKGKSKEEKIPLFCGLSDEKVSLSIGDVFHWPKSFLKGKKISTSFRLENTGNIQARHVSVKLFINNKEKNKIQELIIPAQGYADITLPWIAEKGKNDLRILVL